MKTFTELGQEIQSEFSGKLNHKKLNGAHQILVAIDVFTKWPTVRICKSSETKEVLSFLNKILIFTDSRKKSKSTKAEHLFRKNTKTSVNRKILKSNIAHRDCIPV